MVSYIYLLWGMSSRLLLSSSVASKKVVEDGEASVISDSVLLYLLATTWKHRGIRALRIRTTIRASKTSSCCCKVQNIQSERGQRRLSSSIYSLLSLPSSGVPCGLQTPLPYCYTWDIQPLHNSLPFLEHQYKNFDILLRYFLCFFLIQHELWPGLVRLTTSWLNDNTKKSETSSTMIGS